MAAIRIGTRASQLAMWQAEWVAEQLQFRGHDVELIQVSTRGDVSKQSLSVVGGQGLFTKEIQHELLAERVDVAVHSLKDLPTEPIAGIELAAVPPRETTADCLISREGLSFVDLPAGSRIGTGSSRRGAQLLHWRGDVQIADIRGNVDSRLRKLEEGQYDAIILAAAGLKRLKLWRHVTEEIPVQRMLPAIGQGALGLECRASDAETRAALQELDDVASHRCILAERRLLADLLAGCLAPVAALARIAGGQLTLEARVMACDGSEVIEGKRAGDPSDAVSIGTELAEELKRQGAERLIALARN